MSPYELDQKDMVAEAIQGYEQEIYFHRLDPDIICNLLVIYWDISFDYGVGSHYLAKNIFSQSDLLKFSRRYKEVLAEGIECFPTNPELKFWDRYIGERENHTDHYSSDYFRELMRKNTGFRIPLFYIKSFGANVTKDELAAAEKFKAELVQIPTYKNKYILSYL